MSTLLQSSHQAAQAKLRSCRFQQEAWEKDHEEAMRVFILEALLDDMVQLFTDIAGIRTCRRVSAETSDADP